MLLAAPGGESGVARGQVDELAGLVLEGPAVHRLEVELGHPLGDGAVLDDPPGAAENPAGDGGAPEEDPDRRRPEHAPQRDRERAREPADERQRVGERGDQRQAGEEVKPLPPLVLEVPEELEARGEEDHHRQQRDPARPQGPAAVAGGREQHAEDGRRRRRRPGQRHQQRVREDEEEGRQAEPVVELPQAGEPAERAVEAGDADADRPGEEQAGEPRRAADPPREVQPGGRSGGDGAEARRHEEGRE